MKKPENASTWKEKGSVPGFVYLAGALLLVLTAGFWLSGCAPGLSKKAQITGSRTYKVKLDLRLKGFRRSYRVHVPPGYSPNRPLPLVIAIHGAFDTAKNLERVSGFSELADRENFIVVYPNGMGLFGLLQHWNAGHCCGKAAADRVDDVGFLETVINDVSARLAVNPHRIYMTGFSNGGMLTHRFAAEKGHLLAAAAPLAAAAGSTVQGMESNWSPPAPQTPVPLLTMHGTDDVHVPFAGGDTPRKSGRDYWSVARTLAFWVRHNGCRSKPIISHSYSGRVEISTWHGGPGGADVVLYTIKGWAHQWPGPHFTDQLGPKDPLRGFDAAGIIWDFFEPRHRQ